MPAALEVTGLHKSFGSRRALSGVDLVVLPGQVHGLLGPNGAGKTTLMRVVLGLVAPDAGTVSTSETVSGFADVPSFYPYLSGQKNLRILAKLDGAGDPDERVAQVLAQVGLERDASSRVAGYSAGMRQRLAVAAALLRSPKLLLLDEPTSSLDPGGARELRALILRLSREGVAVLLSSHDLAEVEDLCTAVTILRRGTVAFAGSVAELRERAPEAVHRLRTSDDARALDLAPGGAKVSAAEGAQGLELCAAQAERDAYVLRLGREGVAVRSLETEHRSLESLFLQLTADGGREPAHAPVTPPPPVREAWTAAGTLRVARVEITKLAAQAKVWATLAACLLGPFAFAAAVSAQSTLPEDTLLGRSVKTSGFATPLVILGFATAWAFPVLASVVGGDIFSAEDRYGTWPTILTRSRSRAEIFAGKVLVALAFAAAVTILLGAASTAAGVLVVGRQPLLGLSGLELPPSRALAMVAAAWGSALAPVLAFSAMAVLASVAARSSVAGVGLPVLAAFTMQLASFLDHPTMHSLLLTTAFDAWHALLVDPVRASSLESAATLSCAYLLGCLAVARGLTSARGRPRSTTILGVMAVLLFVVAARSGDGGVTRARLEAGVSPTFANLVSLQVAKIGSPPVAAAELDAGAHCSKVGAPAERTGAGDWTCDLVWHVPSRRAPLHDRYDLHVTSDGCYVASADGEEAHVGGAVIATRTGATMRNLLYAFEGCL